MDAPVATFQIRLNTSTDDSDAETTPSPQRPASFGTLSSLVEAPGGSSNTNQTVIHESSYEASGNPPTAYGGNEHGMPTNHVAMSGPQEIPTSMAPAHTMPLPSQDGHSVAHMDPNACNVASLEYGVQTMNLGSYQQQPGYDMASYVTVPSECADIYNQQHVVYTHGNMGYVVGTESNSDNVNVVPAPTEYPVNYNQYEQAYHCQTVPTHVQHAEGNQPYVEHNPVNVAEPEAIPPPSMEDMVQSVDKESYMDTSGMQFPAVFISNSGVLTVMMKHDVAVEMTLDKALRVVNHRHRAVAAISSRGTSSCIHHPAAKIYQDGKQTEAEIFWNRYASVGPDGIKFAAGGKPCQQMKGDRLESAVKEFTDLSKDMSVTILFSASGYGPMLINQFEEQVNNANYKHHKDGSVTVYVAGVKIDQTPQGDVTVKCGRKFIKVSPVFGSMSVATHCMDMALEMNWNVKVSHGKYRLHASFTGMILSDGRYECGYNQYLTPFVQKASINNHAIMNRMGGVPMGGHNEMPGRGCHRDFPPAMDKDSRRYNNWHGRHNTGNNFGFHKFKSTNNFCQVAPNMYGLYASSPNNPTHEDHNIGHRRPLRGDLNRHSQQPDMYTPRRNVNAGSNSKMAPRALNKDFYSRQSRPHSTDSSSLSSYSRSSSLCGGLSRNNSTEFKQ